MMTANAAVRAPVARGAASGSLWRVGLLAAVLAAVANALVFALAVQVGIFPAFRLNPDAGPQMAIELVVGVSVLAGLAGVGSFALLRRWVERPLRTFLGLAGAALLLSFAAPLALPGTTAQVLVLNLMHLVAAAVVVGLVARWAALTGPS